jgi:hypothetical protein
MKPIDQMTLAECLDALREMNHIQFDIGYDVDIADRIHDLTRWIPVSERMPTEEDADWNGEVIAYSPDPAITVSASSVPMSHHFTHWKRLTPPEDK